MRFIGDIHGDVFAYANIINGSTESVQVGDFGVGFIAPLQEEFVDTQLHADGRHKFIRGNHDNPMRCKDRVGYIEDGTFDEDRSILYIGGAWSIDYAWRTPGYSWWEDEELSHEELARMHELMNEYRPRAVITHDCPTSVAHELFLKGTSKRQYKTRTAEAFERTFHDHQPQLWIFGHWHEDKDAYINGTRFVCLGINSYADFDL